MKNGHSFACTQISVGGKWKLQDIQCRDKIEKKKKMLYVLLLSLCCFCRTIIKLNASQGHNLSAEVQQAAKVPMRRSHQVLISWIFSVNTRMVPGLELNLKVTDYLSVALLGRHIYSLMSPGEECCLFVGKHFQNSTLEYSTSGQGLLCKIS